MANEIEFTFIDERADASGLASLMGQSAVDWATFWDVRYHRLRSLEQMVDYIILLLKPNQKISVLRIIDHGNSKGMEFGDTWVNVGALTGMNKSADPKQKEKLRKSLARLKGKFTKNGYIHMAGCETGNAMMLLIEVSKIVGVPVFAGTGNHRWPFNTNDGKYVCADAHYSDSHIWYKTGRPSVEALTRGKKVDAEQLRMYRIGKKTCVKHVCKVKK